jgi:hypothetical protein
MAPPSHGSAVEVIILGGSLQPELHSPALAVWGIRHAIATTRRRSRAIPDSAGVNVS